MDKLDQVNELEKLLKPYITTDNEGYSLAWRGNALRAMIDTWNAALDWAVENFESGRIADQQIEPIKESILKGKIK